MRGTLTYNLPVEPTDLSPVDVQDGVAGTVLLNMLEGLTLLEEGCPTPGIADGWHLNETGTVYTFHLRFAYWSNGDQVTANNFADSWNRLLLSNSPNREHLHCIEVDSTGRLAVYALDDRTLEVRLRYPVPYFPALVASPPFLPWLAASAKTQGGPDCPCNGPFMLDEWRAGEHIRLVANPSYYAASLAKLEAIYFTFITSPDEMFVAFLGDKIDMNDGGPPPGRTHPDCRELPLLGTHYFTLNTNVPPLNSLQVRRAVNMAVRRSELAPGKPRAVALVPPGIRGDGTDFRAEGGDYELENDRDAARRLLSEARHLIEASPCLEIVTNEQPPHPEHAVRLAEMLGMIGISTKVTVVEWDELMHRMRSGAYGICRAGWIADCLDPMAFLQGWTSASALNQTGWRDVEFDDCIRKAQTCGDSRQRNHWLHKAEDLLMTGLPFIPVHYYTIRQLIKPWVHGIHVSPFGLVDFRNAWIQKS